jgi:hypothetical protein
MRLQSGTQVPPVTDRAVAIMILISNLGWEATTVRHTGVPPVTDRAAAIMIFNFISTLGWAEG